MRIKKTGLDPSSVDSIGRNILHHAALSGSIVNIKRAIELGVDLNSKATDGYGIKSFVEESGNKEAINFVTELLNKPKPNI